MKYNFSGESQRLKPGKLQQNPQRILESTNLQCEKCIIITAKLEQLEIADTFWYGKWHYKFKDDFQSFHFRAPFSMLP